MEMRKFEVYLIAYEICRLLCRSFYCVGMHPKADIVRVVIAILRNNEIHELIEIIY